MRSVWRIDEPLIVMVMMVATLVVMAAMATGTGVLEMAGNGEMQRRHKRDGREKLGVEGRPAVW